MEHVYREDGRVECPFKGAVEPGAAHVSREYVNGTAFYITNEPKEKFHVENSLPHLLEGSKEDFSIHRFQFTEGEGEIGMLHRGLAPEELLAVSVEPNFFVQEMLIYSDFSIERIRGNDLFVESYDRDAPSPYQNSPPCKDTAKELYLEIKENEVFEGKNIDCIEFPRMVVEPIKGKELDDKTESKVYIGDKVPKGFKEDSMEKELHEKNEQDSLEDMDRG